MMRLYACGAIDETPDIALTEDELGVIIIRAAEQETLELVLIALEKLSRMEELKLSPEILIKCKNKLKIMLIDAIKKRAFLLDTFKALEQQGIYPLVLKGEAVSVNYAVPEARSSNDIDLLISTEQEHAAYLIFERLGYAVTPRTEYSNHATCTHPSIGTVELHTVLYEEIIADIVFDNIDYNELVAEEKVDFEIGGSTFKTLGVTDHLIYLILHMIQHFVKSGASVRQLMDIILYIRANKNQINMERLIGILEKLRYKSIYDVVLTAATNCFGIKAQELTDFVYAEESVLNRFINDIETGGWLGGKRERDGVCLRYLGAKRSESMESFEKNMSVYRTTKIKKAIFPDKRRIYRRFPFAEKNILLLPVGWVCWMFYGYKIMRGGTLDAQAPQSFELAADTAVRVALFKDLGMLS